MWCFLYDQVTGQICWIWFFKSLTGLNFSINLMRFKLILHKKWSFPLTLFRMGRRVGKKVPPTSFSPVTSTNVGISPQNFLTFSFNPLIDCCKISSLYLVPVPNYWTWTKTTPQKSDFSGQILIKLRLW